MTLLTLPSTSFEYLELEPDHLIYSTQSRGGYTSEVTFGDPTWGGSMRTTPLSERQLRAWEAFISEATQRMLAFELVHPLRLTPLEYSYDSLPFSGTAAMVNIDDLNSPRLSGLPVGLQLRRGDRVQFTEGDHTAYRMVRSDVLVSSVLDQAVPVTPRLPLGMFTTAASAVFKDPKMRLRVTKNSWSAPLTAGQPTRGTFDVYEAIR